MKKTDTAPTDPTPSLETETPEPDAEEEGDAPVVLGRRMGRPRKPGAPRTEQQKALAATVVLAEGRLDRAAIAFHADPTVAVELEFHLARIGVSSAWAGYLRATGDHTGALKYGEEEARFARVAVGLREVLALDLLDKKKGKAAKPEQALGKRV